MIAPSCTGSAEGEFSAILAQARAGSAEALGQLLETLRHYLLAITQEEMSQALSAKTRASDIVQETMFEAQRDFAKFGGHYESEWRRFVRVILQHNVQNAARYFGRQRRAAGREATTTNLTDPLETVAAPGPTPSSIVAADDERAFVRDALVSAMEQLPGDLCQIAKWKWIDQLTEGEIAQRLDLSVKTVQRRVAEIQIRFSRILNRQP